MTAVNEHPRAAEFEEQAAKHLSDCPFSIPWHRVPSWARGGSSCVCQSVRRTRELRQWLDDNGSDREAQP